MKTITKEKILQRAARLFFADGFSVGIDRIVLECDIAKMTIYGGFKSKDGLIGAILGEVRRAIAERIGKIIEPAMPAPARLQAVFNLVCYGMHDPELRIGLGVRALVEFPHPEHPVHRAALDLENAIVKQFESAGEGPAAIRLTTARQLLLLAKGCFLMAPLLGIKASRQVAMDLATPVIERPGNSYGAPVDRCDPLHSSGSSTVHHRVRVE